MEDICQQDDTTDIPQVDDRETDERSQKVGEGFAGKDPTD